jgi:predicted nucleic acid-binding protein
MHIVSDADVIIHLSKLQKLSLLKSLYSEVAIPEYVKSEIIRKDDDDIRDALDSFLKVFKVSQDSVMEIAKKHDIHPGEANVKALGEKLRCSLFLSNERKVRQAAKEEGFKVAGTIGIILKATKLQMIKKSEAVSLLEKMKAPDFRIHPDILEKAILSVKEL